MVCACTVYVRRGTEGQGSAGGIGGEVLREGRHPELGLQGGFQSLGQACPQGAE